MKTHWRKFDKTDFLGAVDLDEMTPSEITVVIDKVEWKEVKVRGAKGMHRIATFKQNIKPMIINVENGKILQGFTDSKHLEDWVNIPVTIYIKENVKFGTETTDALRFRPNKPVLKNIDNTGAIKVLNGCKDIAELQTEYLGLSSDLQKNKAVIDLKNKLKEQFTQAMVEQANALNQAV